MMTRVVAAVTVSLVRVVAAVTLLAHAGCSFAMTVAPRNTTAWAEVECSDANAAPVADTLGVVLFGIPTGIFLAAGSSAHCSESDSLCFEDALFTMAALFALPALIYGIAAVYGYKNVSDCRSTRRANDRRAEAKRTRFPDRIRTAYPGTAFHVRGEEWRCDVQPRVVGGQARLTGTIHQGAVTIAIDARFTPASGGWRCDETRSQASVIDSGARRNACQVLDETCRGGPR